MFTLKGYEDFRCGVTSDSRQVIIGLLCPHLVAYFFSSEGVLLSREERVWNHPAPRVKDVGPFNVYDEQFVQMLDRQIEEWRSEIGLVWQPIKVQPFFDNHVGAQAMPLDIDDFSWCQDDEALEEAQSYFKDWQERSKRGDWVFYWSKDYEMTADGEVEST